MANEALVGRCGIYCGYCTLYRAYRDDGEFLKQISREWQMPIEKIRCEGCHALTPNCAGHECKLVQCLNAKSFEYCFECPEFERRSCGKFEKSAKKCAEGKVDVRANLRRIKAGEVKNWLRECEEKFRCPRCRKPLPVLGWSGSKCYHCGSDLQT